MPNHLILSNCTILPSPSSPLQHHRYIEITDGFITDIGPMSGCPLSPDRTVIDAEDNLVIAGLINGHNHCAMTLFRGLADDLELSAWLHDHIFPAEAAHVDPEMVYWCTLLAAAEMLLSGTTTVADGYFFSGEAARALSDAGMRAIVAHGIVDFPAPSVPDPSKNIATVRTFLDHWHGRSSRITPAVFAHAAYTCSPQTLRSAKALADERGVRFFIHLAETKTEQSLIIDPHGPTPLRHLANLDVLDPNCTCVHAIWLDDNDLALLADSGAAIVTCPQSNLKLAAGIARIPELLRRSIPLAIGTDGCASNNGLDLFREMDLLAKIHKTAPPDATALPARTVFHLATRGGAQALGLEALGTIVPGALADVVIINLRSPHLTPFYTPDLLVYAASGSDVQTVIVDGIPVVHKGRILAFDLEEVYHHIRPMAKRLGSLRLPGLRPQIGR